MLAIGLASLLGPGAASAGTLVEFPNLPGHTPANLRGYLARPDSGLSAELGGSLNYGAPFPAVVVLHGCAGIFGHSAVIADRAEFLGVRDPCRRQLRPARHRNRQPLWQRIA
jgi:hypothetical protein